MKFKQLLRAWGPALVVMLVIFVFSSRPSTSLPDFAWADRLVKKGGHMLGYGLLALAYWRGFGWRTDHRPFAWLLAISYALTDEFHQAFVPGRTPSLLDVLLFDGTGAWIALLAYGYYSRRRRDQRMSR